MNILKTTDIKTTGNYFCTWDSQCDEIHTRVPAEQELTSRDAMNEEFLFGENGLLNSFDSVRSDLIAVLDDGWDVPYGAKDSRVFGSLEASPERFPSLRELSPAGRLKALSERIRALGYRGLGLWLPTQTPSVVNGKDVFLTPDEERRYWEERAKWCSDAGIMYWKSDWGAHQGDADYCVMMSECARGYAPGLMIEHGLVGRPLFENENDGHETPEWVREYLKKVLPVSDFLRTYDVAHEIKYASTVDRAAVCLEAAAGIQGACAVLNIEDTALIGAALGCSIGVMRHDFEKKRKYLPLPPRPVAESACALIWQRIAPPFAANTGKTRISRERLKDVIHYHDRPADIWPSVPDGYYYVTAPAAISRNMPLPEVSAAGEKPYVLCSVHPRNGAVCCAVTPRTFGDDIDVTPPADISLKAGDSSVPVGLFGSFDSVSVTFDEPVEGKRVYAQDMLSENAVEVTDRVGLSGNRFVVPGEIMTDIGMPEDTECDIPAVAFRLI